MARSNAWGGFWVAARYADVVDAARNEVLTTGYPLTADTVQGVTIPPLGQAGRMAPLEMDAPESLKYRQLIWSFYTADRVAARLSEFRGLASSWLAETAGSGTCDVVDVLTLRLPAVVTLRDLGIPETRWRDVTAMIHHALLSAPHDLDGARYGVQMACLEILEAMDVARSGKGAGPLMAHLLAARIDGAPVADEDIVSMSYLLLLGIDPTSTLTATALWHLSQQPRLRAKLIDDPGSISAVADEYLRWVSPVQSTCRTAAGGTHVGAQDLRGGERVLLSWASANRDEAKFGSPDEIDPGRATGEHVAFGRGVHYCPGAALVRGLFVAMVEQVLTAMPSYEVLDEDAVEWFPDITSVYGVCRLPVKFTSSAAG
ncbi:hypothetical protein CF165_48125 [Amycolatopsis vastitatis]|uniref:Cytochrome P450 n=2 Tax=Amycolatopsis vastitatis TaxID=1905142 RepID=A0A229SKP8_9PSEU|nr:hypothetical protein CF165_48125 [Amycolatopsis vastitatis]